MMLTVDQSASKRYRPISLRCRLVHRQHHDPGERGELSIVPVWGDSLLGDPDLGADEADEFRSMKAEQQTMVDQGHHYIAITPHDQPFTMLEVLPASEAAALSGIHEVPHESICVDLIWDLV